MVIIANPHPLPPYLPAAVPLPRPGIAQALAPGQLCHCCGGGGWMSASFRCGVCNPAPAPTATDLRVGADGPDCAYCGSPDTGCQGVGWASQTRREVWVCRACGELTVLADDGTLTRWPS